MPPQAEGLISSALERHAVEGIRRGWGEVRPGGEIPEAKMSEAYGLFVELVMSSPAAMGRRLANGRASETPRARTRRRAACSYC